MERYGYKTEIFTNGEKMLVIRVEIWPFGNSHQARTISWMEIVNIKTNPDNKADYNIETAFTSVGYKNRYETKTIKVTRYNRDRGAWRLIYSALKKIFREDKDWGSFK